MENHQKPSFALAEKTLPRPLLQSLVDLFAPGLGDSVLVGGSALSGFYAAHRRSDDLDVYTRSEESFRALTLSIKNLRDRGVSFRREFSSAMYYRAACERDDHNFTIDGVLDAHFFEVGRWHSIENGLAVASLETLLMTKSAAMVSRAGEKDLYDLIWLFGHLPGLSLDEFIEYGRKIDGGLNRESLLLSLSGAVLKEEACDFSLDPAVGAGQVFAQIQSMQKQLIKELSDIRKVKPPRRLAEIVRRIKKLR
jgi:hypothetical protein